MWTPRGDSTRIAGHDRRNLHIRFATVTSMSTRRSAITPLRRAALPAPPLPATTARWALFLDVDGTLLEFADDPSTVTASVRLLMLLQALHRALGGALALVSGRTLADLDRLFNCPAWAAVGLHGLELRYADGTRRQIEVVAAQRSRMRDAVNALAVRLAGIQVEDKGAAIALHCRHAPRQLAALRTAAHALAAQLHGYEVQVGHQVVEFKPAGVDKGRAVTELLQCQPFANRQPVYLGDDLTDEHAFSSINTAHGISVRVGSREPTQANFSLSGPTAVEAWLRRVLTTITQGISADV
jgi:trehalose 6-phosphate phosphatase